MKYLCAGVTAFVVEFGSFLLLLHLGLHTIAANSISFILGLLTSFTINRIWTFSGKTYAKRMHHQLARYVTLALINLLLTNLIVQGLIHFNVSPSAAKIAAMIVTSMWNFILLKVAVFKHHPEQN
jgi:putative flippase GtrA